MKIRRIAMLAAGLMLMAAPAMATPVVGGMSLIDLFWWLRR